MPQIISFFQGAETSHNEFARKREDSISASFGLKSEAGPRGYVASCGLQ